MFWNIWLFLTTPFCWQASVSLKNVPVRASKMWTFLSLQEYNFNDKKIEGNQNARKPKHCNPRDLFLSLFYLGTNAKLCQTKRGKKCHVAQLLMAIFYRLIRRSLIFSWTCCQQSGSWLVQCTPHSQGCFLEEAFRLAEFILYLNSF